SSRAPRVARSCRRIPGPSILLGTRAGGQSQAPSRSVGARFPPRGGSARLPAWCRTAPRRVCRDHRKTLPRPGELSMARMGRTGTAFALLFVLSPLAGSADEPSPSALEQSPSGWTDLLAKAGPDLAGWTRVPLPTKGKLEPLGAMSQWSLDP